MIFCATCGYLGNIPLMPGTFGTLPGVLMCYLLSLLSPAAAALCAVALIVVATIISEISERVLEKKDPGCIVIDEVAGMVVTMMGIPFNWQTAVTGFILFRFFDMVKPPPVRQVQASLTGGGGVVMDDVAAGILANILLRIIWL